MRFELKVLLTLGLQFLAREGISLMAAIPAVVELAPVVFDRGEYTFSKD